MAMSEADQDVLGDAFERDDAAKFKRLISAHPEALRNQNERCTWLFSAAQAGHVKIVRVLLKDFGVSANEQDSSGETALQRASWQGHIDVVRCLLDHGATMVDEHGNNYALIQAVGEGHLDLVKFLIEEHGADPNTSFGWPLLGAEGLRDDEGRPRTDVADYLRSVGAKMPWEQVPWNLPAGHALLRQELTKHEGYKGEATRLPDDGKEPVIGVYVVPPGDKRRWQTLFTVGMSDRLVKFSEWPGFMRFLEVKLSLPEDWPLTPDALADPKWQWPVQWLRRIARNPGALVAHEQPPRPLGPNTQLSHLLLSCRGAGDGIPVNLADHREVWLAELRAFYPEEQQHHLLEKVPRVISADRPNLAKQAPPAPVKKLTLKEVKKAALNLPDDLVAYLKSDAPKQWDFKAVRTMCGSDLKLLPLKKLKVELLEVGVETTPYEDEQPDEGRGYYAVPAVNITNSGAFLWLPTEGRYGAYDDEHNPLMMLRPDITWTDIAADMETYFEAINSGGTPDFEYAEYLRPWPKYPFVKQ
jgi:hypothetical protein